MNRATALRRDDAAGQGGAAAASGNDFSPAPPGKPSPHRPKLYLASHRRPDGRVVTFDANGNRAGRITKTTSQMGVEERRYGRLGEVTHEKKTVVTFTDPTHPSVFETKYQFDTFGRMLRLTYPDGEILTNAYDAAGNLTQLTDPKGQVRKYTYDSAGRITQETHFPAGATTAAKTVSYGYNELRRLTAYDDGATAASYAYDNPQRKTQETVNYGPFSLSYAYSYYANGSKKSFTYPDGVSYAYTYDPNNQLSAIQLPTGAITVNAYTWTAPEQITLPGGTTRKHQYDPLMRLTNLSAKDAYQNSLLSYQYSYDKAGNITQKSTEHGNYDYGYDSLYRLKTAANPSPLANEAYGYDPAGNRTTDSNLPGNWSYDENNALLAAGAIAFGYDANGNTVKKTAGAQTMSLAYDTSDRLTEAKDAQGNTLAKYAYDPFGRRLWKETNNQKTYFLYADEGLIGEYDPSGAQTRAYGYRPDSTWTTDPLYLKQGSKYYFYQNDHLGTAQKLADVQGNVVWSARAQAFGTTTVDAGSTVTNNLRFAGQYYDQETGLHYNWNRYYDPKTGRYISEDPVGLDGGLNTYAYVFSDPINLLDPTGLETTGRSRFPWRGIISKICDAAPKTLEQVENEISKNAADTYEQNRRLYERAYYSQIEGCRMIACQRVYEECLQRANNEARQRHDQNWDWYKDALHPKYPKTRDALNLASKVCSLLL